MAVKKETNRRVNIFCLVAAACVFGTGLVLFFQFHVGHGRHHNIFAGMPKWVWVDIHRTVAVLFLGGLALHIWLHVKYVENVARRWGKGLSDRLKKTSKEQILLFIACAVVITTGFYAWAALPGRGFRGGELRHHWIDVHNIVGLFLLTGLSVHIKRRWRRIFPPPARAAARSETPAPHGG